MPLASLTPLVNSLLSELPDETSPAVIVVKPERPVTNARKPTRSRVDPNRPTYNPGIVYVLELATILTLRDDESIGELGENLTASLQNLIRDAKNVHPLVISRAVYYFLNLLRRSYVSFPPPGEYKTAYANLKSGTSIHACPCCPPRHIEF